MKMQISSMLRFCMIAGVSMAVLAGGVADAAQQRTRRDCKQDWRAHKAMYQTSGKTRRTFMRECRARPVQPSALQPGAATKQ
jgi:hypothetical protein